MFRRSQYSTLGLFSRSSRTLLWSGRTLIPANSFVSCLLVGAFALVAVLTLVAALALGAAQLGAALALVAALTLVAVLALGVAQLGAALEVDVAFELVRSEEQTCELL